MHCVYKITFTRRKELNRFPYYYIGSKSNCTYINNILLDKKGKQYFGSSNYKNYKNIVETEKDNLIFEILYSSNIYDEVLLYEKNIHIKNNVVLSNEYFNQQIATLNTYSNPEYKTMKNLKNGKTTRLLESEITEDWVGVSSGKKWYNNGEINKTFNLNEVPDGWIKGRLNYKSNPNNFYKNGKEETIKKGVETRMKNGSYVAYNKGKKGLYKHSEETKKKFKNRERLYKEKNGMYNKMFITDGIINKVVDKNFIIPHDWKKGLTKKAK